VNVPEFRTEMGNKVQLPVLESLLCLCYSSEIKKGKEKYSSLFSSITFFKRGPAGPLLNSAKEHPTASMIRCHVGFSRSLD
jgi:hypothetical protein